MNDFKSEVKETLEKFKSLKTNEEKEEMLQNILLEKEDYQIKCLIYEERFSIDKARQYAKRSEQIELPGVYQLNLFDNSDIFNEAETIQTEKVEYEEITYKRKKKNKNSINIKNKNLHEVRIKHSLEGDDCNCPICGNKYSEVGTSEVRTYNFVPAKLEVFIHEETSYKCIPCEKDTGKAVIVSAKRKTAFPKSMAEDSLVSHIIVKKYLEHVPLYRQEKLFNNMGLDASRVNFSNWVIRAAEVLKPIFDLMYKDLLKKDICHMDETTLKVISNGNKQSYMWGLSSSKYDDPVYLYFYKPSRAHHNAKDILQDFKGYVHSDAYPAYQKLNGVTNVGCFAHARRKFVEIIKASNPESSFYQTAKVGKEFIDKLYKVEHKLRDKKASINEIYETRNTESRAILNNYFEWLKLTSLKFMPNFAISKAINYSLNNMEFLKNYLLDARLEIDNNRSERMLKSFVIGRKNFLFCFSESGAHTSSILYSIIETAYANNLRVEQYLTYLFNQLPIVNINDLTLNSLLPYSKDLPQKLRIIK